MYTHAGGVGLCQMAAHLAAIDYICIANTTEDRITEYVDHLQQHFVNYKYHKWPLIHYHQHRYRS